MKIQPSIVIQLIHIHGSMKGIIQEFPEGYVTIGRHPSSSVCFSSDKLNSISRNHAEIIREGNQFKLLDHSKNGTFLNGRKVAEAYLKDGDVLEFSEGGPKVSFLAAVSEVKESNPPAETNPVELEAHREEIVLDRPEEAAHVQPVQNDDIPPHPPPATSYRPTQSLTAAAQPSLSKPPEDLPTGTVTAPLVIQFGPSLRSFRELPVTIGSNPAADYVIIHPAIINRHAQIIFTRDQYWIKDLSGQGLIRVNNVLIPFQAALNVNDLVSLVPHGPAFRFLGEGRFAEAEEAAETDRFGVDTGSSSIPVKPVAENVGEEGLWARLKKRF